MNSWISIAGTSIPGQVDPPGCQLPEQLLVIILLTGFPKLLPLFINAIGMPIDIICPINNNFRTAGFLRSPFFCSLFITRLVFEKQTYFCLQNAHVPLLCRE